MSKNEENNIKKQDFLFERKILRMRLPFNLFLLGSEGGESRP